MLPHHAHQNVGLELTNMEWSYQQKDEGQPLTGEPSRISKLLDIILPKQHELVAEPSYKFEYSSDITFLELIEGLILNSNQLLLLGEGSDMRELTINLKHSNLSVTVSNISKGDETHIEFIRNTFYSNGIRGDENLEFYFSKNIDYFCNIRDDDRCYYFCFIVLYYFSNKYNKSVCDAHISQFTEKYKGDIIFLPILNFLISTNENEEQKIDLINFFGFGNADNEFHKFYQNNCCIKNAVNEVDIFNFCDSEHDNLVMIGHGSKTKNAIGNQEKTFSIPCLISKIKSCEKLFLLACYSDDITKDKLKKVSYLVKFNEDTNVSTVNFSLYSIVLGKSRRYSDTRIMINVVLGTFLFSYDFNGIEIQN